MTGCPRNSSAMEDVVAMRLGRASTVATENPGWAMVVSAASAVQV